MTPPDAELAALLTLRFTPFLGPLRIAALLRAFGSAEAALLAPDAAWRAVPGMEARALAARRDSATRVRAHEELRHAAREGVALLGRGRPDYPAALEALPDPPVVLWRRGELPALDLVPRAVGVVGTRGASAGALALARTLSADFARAGAAVVSGLARGVDTAAHGAALDAGGVTVAVLGSGVNVVYPPENARLAKRAVLLSEHPLGTPPAAHHFPGRNRLIAALSAATVMVEGDVISGAMITAYAALECGRTVFAVPGRPGERLSAGPHKLLREGAALCERAEDVFQELGWSAAPPRPAPALGADLAPVYAALDRPALLDDLAVRLERAPHEVQAALSRLALGGHVVELPGGRFARR